MITITVLPSGLVERSEVWTIVVGGGSGQRFGRPKQYELLGEERIIDRSRRVATGASDGVVVVVPPADAEREHAVAGGASRTDSVRAGLAAVPDSAAIICVHDAARPFATNALYEAVVAAVLAGADAAVPGIAVADTIKLVDDDDVVQATPDRDRLRAVQTPQAFRAEILRAVHRRDEQATDDAALVEREGGRVVVVDGDPNNRKITVPDDLEWARQFVAAADADVGGAP